MHDLSEFESIGLQHHVKRWFQMMESRHDHANMNKGGGLTIGYLYLFHTALLTYHMYLLWVLQVLLRNLLYESGTVALGNSQVSLPHIFLDFSHVSTLSFTIPPYKITVRFWHYSSWNFAGTSSTHHCWHLTCKNSQFHNSFLESYCMIMTQ